MNAHRLRSQRRSQPSSSVHDAPLHSRAQPSFALARAVLTLLFGSLFSSIDVAGATLPSFMSVCLFFSGFLLPFPNLPVYWKWASV